MFGSGDMPNRPNRPNRPSHDDGSGSGNDNHVDFTELGSGSGDKPVMMFFQNMFGRYKKSHKNKS